VSWTYSGDPAASSLDAVRFLVGDTDTDDQLVTDEEIMYLLAQVGNVYAAARDAARAITAKFARMPDQSVDGLSYRYSQRAASFSALAARLDRQSSMRSAGPVAGGLSRARKQTVEQDADRVAPSFERDQFSFPGTESSDPDNLRDLDDL